MINDTIAAISTPIGAAGIGIIRVSGSAAVSIVERVFRSSRERKIEDAGTYRLLHGFIVDKSGDVVDEVLVSVMRGPHSFTAEDVVEINCHGGLIAVRRTLAAVLEAGARPAEAGEFSKRAFLNGRIDLAQAESIIDLITAKTEKSLNVAVNQLEGILSQEIRKMRAQLMELLAHIEAGIDFPEHDIEEISLAMIEERSKEILHNIKKLINTSETGKIFREGLKTVIAGKPNVGKSSLLNALLKENRAIVTDIPGTTRDVIEEIVNIRGIPLKLVDTAGIRETEDLVEKIGVEKTKEMFADADLIFLMIDASSGIGQEDKEIFPLARGKKTLVLINKIDIKKETTYKEIEKYTGRHDIIEMSLLTGQGLEKLEKRIEDIAYAGLVSKQDELMVSNIRHKHTLERTACSMEGVISALEEKLPTDCMAIDLKAAWESLGEITGETVSEDLVDQIFSRFCIGK